MNSPPQISLGGDGAIGAQRKWGRAPVADVLLVHGVGLDAGGAVAHLQRPQEPLLGMTPWVTSLVDESRRKMGGWGGFPAKHPTPGSQLLSIFK